MDPALTKYCGYGTPPYYDRRVDGVALPWGAYAGSQQHQYYARLSDGVMIPFGADAAAEAPVSSCPMSTVMVSVLTGFFLGMWLGEHGERRRVYQALNLR